MALWSVFLIALGVSADAFAVALGKGLHLRTLTARTAIVIPITFGLFQAVMPLLGWLVGTAFAPLITGVDHWIAFGLLALIGAKMLWDAFHASDDAEDVDRVPLRELLILGLATSIDALAIGVSFAFLDVSIVVACVTIGVTTFLLALAGVFIGHRVGTRFERPAEIGGGVILILIGTKILLEHLGVIAF